MLTTSTMSPAWFIKAVGKERDPAIGKEEEHKGAFKE